MGAPARSPSMTSAIASGLGSAALSIGAGVGRLAWHGVKAGTSAAFDLATAGNRSMVPEEDRPQAPWYERPESPSLSDSPQAPRGGYWFYPGSANPPPRESRSANPPPHFVDAAPWNGTGVHAITISDDDGDDEAEVGLGLAVPHNPAPVYRPPSNPVSQRDTRLARETMAGLGPNYGRGTRRRGV